MAEKSLFTDPAYRAPGVHRFELSTGLAVTGVSANTWDEYEQHLRELSSTSKKIGDIILSPELVTAAPDPAPDESNQAIVQRAQSHVATAAEISQGYPDSTLIIGTIIPLQRTDRFANGAVYIKNGERVGETRKMPYSPFEAQYFAQATRSVDSRPLPNHPNVLPIICSDLLFHKQSTPFKRDALPVNRGAGRYIDPITPDVDTLLVSSYWQIPSAGAQEYIRPDDNDYGGSYMYQMRDAARMLFDRYASLQDIVVVDRQPTRPPENPLQPVYPPYNAHFQRGAWQVS